MADYLITYSLAGASRPLRVRVDTLAEAEHEASRLRILGFAASVVPLSSLSPRIEYKPQAVKEDRHAQGTSVFAHVGLNSWTV